MSPLKTTVAFSRPVNLSFVASKTHLYFGNELVNGQWESLTGTQYDVLWIFKHNAEITEGLDVKVIHSIIMVTY